MKKEAREGYKITELGEIPNEWSVKKLKDIGYSVIGLTYSPDDLVEKENGILVLRSSNIKNSRISYDDNKYVNKVISEKQIVKKEDILICSRNGSKELIGKCAIIDEEAEGSSFGAFMTVFRSDYNKYLFHVFNSYLFKRQIYNNIGATINQITTDNLNNFKVIIPTNDEQEKISLILSTVDEQIDNTEKLIQKNQELKRGLMQQLLTKGIGHKEFKETELGEIPKEWEVKKIGEISDFCSNGFVGTATPYYSEKGTFYLMSNNVRENKIDTRNMIKVNDKFVSLYPRSKIYKDDMLTVQSGHIGTSCVVTQEYDNCNCHALIITRFKKRFVDSNFISYYLNSDKGKDRLSSIFVGSTIKHINVKDLVKFFVPVPEIYEQRKIVSILSSLDGKIEQYRNKKEKLEEMKKGLMQQLLKGKIRVV
ncbi:TPA: restriction endonuclease subunit S [Clostridium perfringens]|uniref:restriction endonuclease subunit S n=1 Tax=Clostridium perfringens TaxID=1502 RepID=UPI0024BC2B04|nr:restriction endonuclease subunit S [Clostridium perfringens]